MTTPSPQGKPEPTLTPVNKPIGDFVKDFDVGMLLVMEDGRRILIGDLNKSGGSCSCCGVDYDTDVVLGFYMVW